MVRKENLILIAIIILIGFQCVAYESFILPDDTQRGSGINLKLSHSIKTWFYYAPEVGYKTENHLGIYTSVITKENNSATFYMYGLYESSGGGFEIPIERKIRPWISHLRINLRGPIISNMKPITFTIGQGIVNYSPYVAFFNTDYSTFAQGLMLQGLQWNKYDLSGFLVLESNKKYQDVGEGIRIRYNSGPLKVETILARHLHGDPIIKNGQIEKIGIYNLLEKDLQINVDYRLSNGVSFNALHIDQHKIGVPLSSMKMLECKSPQKGLQWMLSYRDCDPDFSPRYRDRTPREVLTTKFRNFDEVLSGWNPVDKYKNKQGMALGVSGSIWEKPARLQLEHYILKTESKPTTNFEVEFGKKVNLGLLGIYDYADQPFKYLESGVRFGIVKSFWAEMYGQAKYVYDKNGKNNDLNVEGVIKQYGIDCSFMNGFFRGLAIDFGVQRAKENYWYVKGNWLMFRNIQILFAYRYPNINEDNDLWTDELNRVRYRDNFLSLLSSISF